MICYLPSQALPEYGKQTGGSSCWVFCVFIIIVSCVFIVSGVFHHFRHFSSFPVFSSFYLDLASCVNWHIIMSRVLHSQSHRSQHRIVSTAQATANTLRQTRGRGDGSCRTRGWGRGTAHRGLQTTTMTIAPTTTIGQSRGRRTTWRDTEQPVLQPSQQEDREPVGDLEHLQSMIRSETRQVLAASFPQSNPQPTNVPGPSPTRDSYPLSATLPASGMLLFLYEKWGRRRAQRQVTVGACVWIRMCIRADGAGGRGGL